MFKQFSNPEMRFILVQENSKRPLENDWQNTNNYSIKELTNKMQGTNYNYGVACGYGNVLVVDIDSKGKNFIELTEIMFKFAPQTFVVKTKSGGYHFYYKMENPTNIKPITLKNENGEMRWKGQQVIAPGSTIEKIRYEPFNEVEIAITNIENLKTILANFLPNKEMEFTATEGKKIELNITDIANLSALTRHSDEYFGSHPTHGSEHGSNFWINTNKNVWHCFRHNTGGDALQLFAMQEHIINCEDCGKNALMGEKFKKALQLLEEKKGIKIKKPITELSKKIGGVTDFPEVIEKFVKENGIYYDEKQMWWLWNEEDFSWEICDETDLLIAIDDAMVFEKHTLESQIKNLVLEGLKRSGRRNKPVELKSTQIQFKKKIIDIETGEEMPATKNFFCSNPIPWEIGETSETPVIDKLIVDWVGENKKQVLYEILAFAICSEYFIHRIFALVGGGSNGKSTYFKVIRKFVGNKNFVSTELENLASSRFESSKMYKKLVCLLGETNFGIIEQTSLLKRLTGQDPVGVEFKGKDPFDTINYAKIIIATNTLPVTMDKTDGFYRRWNIIDFPNQFEEKTGVFESIPEQEYSALAKKTIGLLIELRKTCKFSNDGTIEQRRLAFEEKSNPINEFIKKDCIVGINETTPFFIFYDSLIGFLSARKLRQMTKNEVGRFLEQEGYRKEIKSVKKADGATTSWLYYTGLRMKGGLEIDY